MTENLGGHLLGPFMWGNSGQARGHSPEGSQAPEGRGGNAGSLGQSIKLFPFDIGHCLGGRELKAHRWLCVFQLDVVFLPHDPDAAIACMSARISAGPSQVSGEATGSGLSSDS